MKTTAAPKKRARAARSLAGRLALQTEKHPKWVGCGPAASMTREEIIAGDESFLEQMKAGRRTTQTAASLVREARG
jgi:hypothetical protein